MKLDSKKKSTVLDGTGILIVNVIFFTLNEFLRESRKDFIASSISNIVQPQVRRKPGLFRRFKMVVRDVD